MSQAGESINPALVDALRRKVKTLESELETEREARTSLQERVDQLEHVVETEPARREWDELTREDKVRQIRVQLIEQARDGHGSMTYRDVKYLFDGNPSPGHCYDLMEHAGDATGFEYGEAPDGSKRITVKTAAVKDEALIRATNKADSSVEV